MNKIKVFIFSLFIIGLFTSSAYPGDFAVYGPNGNTVGTIDRSGNLWAIGPDGMVLGTKMFNSTEILDLTTPPTGHESQTMSDTMKAMEMEHRNGWGFGDDE